MKTKILTLALAWLLCLSFSVRAAERNLLQTAISGKQLANSLITDQSWVKYPRYADRAGWDALLGDDKNTFIKRGETAAQHAWIAIRATDYLEYYRSGNRSTMEKRYDSNIHAIVNLFFAELAEGKGRFTEPLMDLVFSACEMTSWSISAHVKLQKNNKRFPQPDDYAVELVSSDVGALLAWIHFYLKEEFDKIEPSFSPRIAAEINRRIIQPYMENNHYWWQGFNLAPGGLLNNWTPWCNGNVLQCMLLLADDSTPLAEQVEKTMQSVDKYLNFIHADGACDEGPSYWGHAAGKLFDYLSLLYEATGGKADVFTHPMIRNMGEYISRTYIGDNWVVNFADASAQNKPNYALIYRYGKAVQSEEMIRFAAYLKQINGTQKTPFEGRDALRLFEALYCREALNAVAPRHQSPSYTWYPETQFCYLNGKEMFVALKGGHNNESHNHNDVGTFSLWVDNEPVIIDVGVGTYTRQTFSSERYTIWTMQSLYHNLPEIDGKQQAFGTNYRAENVQFDARRSTFSLDIQAAYPQETGHSVWNRRYVLKGKTLTISDKFSIENPTVPNAIHFMTRGNVAIQPGKINLAINGKKAQLVFDARLFDASLEPISITDKRLSDVWGQEICRIKLKAKRLDSKGVYEYKIIRM